MSVIFTLTIPKSNMTLAAKMNKLVPIMAEYAIWTPVIKLDKKTNLVFTRQC